MLTRNELISNIKKYILSIQSFDEQDSSLDSLVDENGAFSIPKKIYKDFCDMLDNFVEISIQEGNVDSITNHMFKKDNEQKFAKAIKNFCASRLSAHNDTTFLRNMEYEDFCKIVSSVFLDHIMTNNNDPENPEDDNDNKILITFKFINTFCVMLLEEFFSVTQTHISIKKLFYIQDDKIDYVIDLILKNESSLKYKLLMEKLSAIEQKINNIAK